MSSAVEPNLQDNCAKPNMPASARIRQKRPDLQVYVPRKHQVALVSDGERPQTREVVSPEKTNSANVGKCENSVVRRATSSKPESDPVNEKTESKRYSEGRRRDVPECVVTHRGGEKLHVHRSDNLSDNNTDSSLEWDYETDIHIAKMKYRDDDIEASNAPLKDLEFDDDELEPGVVKPGKRRRRRRRKPAAQDDGDVPATTSQSWADIMEMEEKGNVAPCRVSESELGQTQSLNKMSGGSIESAIADVIFDGLVIKNSGRERVKNGSRDFAQGSGDNGDGMEKGRQGGTGSRRGERRRSRSQGNNSRRRHKNSVSDSVTVTDSGQGRREWQRTERRKSEERKDIPPKGREAEQQLDRAGGRVSQTKYETAAVVRERRNSENISHLTETVVNRERHQGRTRDTHNPPLKVVLSGREGGRQVHVTPAGLPARPRETEAKKSGEMNPVLGDRGVMNVRGVLPAPHLSEHLTASPQHPPHRGAHHGRGAAASIRGGSHRTLFDPNNPTKPIQVSSPKLQFQDPFESQYSPDSSCFYDGYTPIGGPPPGPYGATYPVQYSGTGPPPSGGGVTYVYPTQAYVDDSYNDEHFPHRFVQCIHAYDL